MAWLAKSGYEGGTLDQVERAWYHGGTLPAKPILITFDNGYPAQVRLAPKVLGRYSLAGSAPRDHRRTPHAPYIRPVVAMGWEVDSLSATHPDLTQISGAELEYQVAASRG
jgi:hypothetical protein